MKSSTKAAFVYGSLLAGHALTETARDALYLERHDPAQLPAVYAGLAVAAAVVTWLMHVIPDRGRPGRRPVGVIALGAVVALIFGVASMEVSSGWGTLLYLWTGVFGMVSTSTVWAWMAVRTDLSRARQEFTRIGMGGIIGAIIGSLIAVGLSQFAETQWLLIVAAVILAGTAVGAYLWARADVHSMSLAPDRGATGKVEQRRYAALLFAFILVGAASLTAGDLAFKATVAERVPPNELATVFGVVAASTDALALAVQTLITPFILRRLGLQAAMVALPVAFGGVLALGIGGAVLQAAVGLRGVAGALSHSLHGTATELLYMPFEVRIRRRLATTFQPVGHRAGQALAALLVAGAFGWGLGVSEGLFALVLVLALLWLAVALATHRSYLAILRTRLDGFEPDPSAPLPSPALSEEALETVLRSLTLDETTCLAALRLLDRHARADLVPPSLLAHPSGAVVLATIELLVHSQRPDVSSLLARCLASRDDEVRSRAASALLALRGDVDVAALRGDPSPAVRVIGLTMARRDPSFAVEALAELEATLEMGDRETTVALLRAWSHAPADDALDTLVFSVIHKDARHVAGELADAARVRPHPVLLGALVEVLTLRESRDAVHAALAAIGEPALAFLEAQTERTDLRRAVRLQLPDAIGAFLTPRAGQVLLALFRRETDGGMRYGVLRALGRFAHDGGPLPELAETMDTFVERTVHRLVKLTVWRHRIAEQFGAAVNENELLSLLDALLLDKHQAATERLFRGLGLRGLRGEDPEALFEGLRSGEKHVREGARELLEHALEGPLREAIVALYSEAATETRLQRAADALGIALAPHDTWSHALERELREDGSASIRAIAGRAFVGRAPKGAA
jgi:AAA family ATP:ADP antiporter